MIPGLQKVSFVAIVASAIAPAVPGEARAQGEAGAEWVGAPGNILGQRPEVYAGEEARRIAETILLHQRSSGGWPKNYDRARRLSDAERAKLRAEKKREDSTIDNGATHTELRYLARVARATGDERYRGSFLRGVEYLLRAQYPNGGWPQFFPKPRGYQRYITFNDGAMIGAMALLRDLAREGAAYPFVDAALRARCARAVERGIECILKCQIEVGGRKTAWCAQHDEKSFAPRKARSYELPSLSGSESVGIVRFLMEIEEPSPEVVEAVEGAVAWFERAKLTGFRVEKRKAESTPRGWDKVVVEDPAAPPMWARFYEIGTNRPIFSSRDGVARRALAEISYERRNGYGWLGYWPARLLEKELPAWRKKHGRRRDARRGRGG